MLRRALPLVILAVIAACGGPSTPAPATTPATAPAPQPSTPAQVQPPAPFSIGDSVRMTGFDPVTGRVEVAEINAWTTAQRTELKCRVKHGAAATISGLEYVAADERWYVSISSGSCAGWVPESFVEARSR